MRLTSFVVALACCVVGCGDDGGKPDPTLETTLDSQPPALTNQAAAAFTFHSDPAGDQFVCLLDSGQPVQCHSPFTQTVGEGAHVFTVATLGAHATLDPTPAMATWTVDLTPPDTTITAMPPAVDNTVSPTFEFTGTDPNSASVTFECSLDGDPFTACPEPQQLTVTDGSHDFAVRAVDAAGNVDPSPASYTWVVDTSTPDTMITAGPANAGTSGTNTSFGFASATSGATFECRLDTAAFAACTTPLALGPLAGGSHTFAVRAVDSHLVVDPTPATRTWTVDATAPDVTITQKPPNPDNDATPDFGFTSTDATATFSCRVDAATLAACTSVWTSASLADGGHTFEVRATDPFGNFSNATYAWTIDTVAPTVTITGGPSDPPGTKNASPSFTFTTAGAPIATDCALDAGTFAACTSPVAFTSLADATHVLVVRATDAAGNAGTAMRTFTVDTMPPVVTFTTVPASPTNDTTPTWTFTVAGGAVATTCQIDAGTIAACTSPFTSAVLSSAAHVLTVRATDAVGNVGSATSSVTIDTTPPTVTITSGPIDPTPTNDPTPSFGFTVGGGPATTTCKVDAGAAASCTSPFVTASLADGGHTLTIVATDTAGNTGQATRAFTIDTAAPSVAITTGPIDPTPTNDKTPSFDFTVTGGPATTTCKIDGGAAASCTSPFTSASLADGGHTLTVVATDTAGNAGTATRTFTIDATPPGLTIDTGPIDPTPTSDTTPTFTFTVTLGPATTTCHIDANAPASCASPFTAAALLDGGHTLTVVATDTAGNARTATRTFTVDTVAPTVTITGGPSDPPGTKNASPSFTFTTAGSPTSIDCSLDAAAFVACTSPVAFTTLSDATHVLVVRATDAAGNSGTAMRTFTVDTIPPVVTFTVVPASPTNDPTPTWAFTVAGGAVTTTCQMDSGTIAACTSPFTATTLSSAVHVLTVRATDAVGNVGTATSSVTIDTVPPTVTITTGPIDPTPTKDPTPSFDFTIGGGPATTTCQIDTGTVASCTSPFTSTALADGGHTLTVVATDTAGNTGGKTRAFTIDTIAPIVTITTGPIDPTPTNDKTPSFDFTVTGGPATTSCQIDSGAIASCTSPFTSAALADGCHTLTVVATDTAGNAGSTSRAFTIDTTPPTLVFDDVPPSNWPVDYYDMGFHAGESGVTFTCSLNGAAFTACANGISITTQYDVLSTFAVKGADALGNAATISTTWVSSQGLVLHYPWEQASLANTSLLAQRSAYSPNGVNAQTAVGGWAGTAIGNPTVSAYKNTQRSLSSSVGGAYTASVWIRPRAGTDGIVWSTVDATAGGIQVAISGTTVQVTLFKGGTALQKILGTVVADRWSQITVRSKGTTSGLDLIINGAIAGSTGTPSGNGFDAMQSKNLIVGSLANADLDDLRFYNKWYDDTEICTVIARGIQGANCAVLAPTIEFDFENNYTNTGTEGLPVQPPQAATFVAFDKLGLGMEVLASSQFAVKFYAKFDDSAHTHSISFWFEGGALLTIFDFVHPCIASAPTKLCGMRASYTAAKELQIDSYNNSDTPKSAAFSADNAVHGVVITEQKTGNVTDKLTVYIDGTLVGVLDIGGAYNVFANPSDIIQFPSQVGARVDEIEFWDQDLSTDKAMLCENGFDGQFDPVNSVCVLTSN